MAVTTWTAGQVLAAQDLNDTLASKVDYALPVNAQTGTTYTFVAADAEKLTTASNAAAVTLTIPPQSSVTWSDNTVLRVVNYGAGAVTIDGGSGVTVTNTSSTIAQYGAAVAIRTGSDAWTVVPFGGGDVPSATVSSPAATGQYTDGGGQTWDYYTFTSSGTLTVDTAGFADVLLVGGGGGGGAARGGGGGAGGYLYITNAYLAAGSTTITVGAGGVASRTISTVRHGYNGNASRCGSYYALGGGAGAAVAGDGFTGGSGGGCGGGNNGFNKIGGAGDQGNAGGAGITTTASGGGGGGAGAVGGAAGNNGGAGGAGLASTITGSSVTRAGGGGGGENTSVGSGGAGGTGGGGAGGTSPVAGTANTGGGGGGGAGNGTQYAGAAGGSGVVIVRVKV